MIGGVDIQEFPSCSERPFKQRSVNEGRRRGLVPILPQILNPSGVQEGSTVRVALLIREQDSHGWFKSWKQNTDGHAVDTDDNIPKTSSSALSEEETSRYRESRSHVTMNCLVGAKKECQWSRSEVRKTNIFGQID